MLARTKPMVSIATCLRSRGKSGYFFFTIQAMTRPMVSAANLIDVNSMGSF